MLKEHYAGICNAGYISLPCIIFEIQIDFDGVIHSYKSGWNGITEIPDEPVDGIKEAIAGIRKAGYEVIVVSTRCNEPAGMAAIKKYLKKYEITVDDICFINRLRSAILMTGQFALTVIEVGGAGQSNSRRIGTPAVNKDLSWCKPALWQVVIIAPVIRYM